MVNLTKRDMFAALAAGDRKPTDSIYAAGCRAYWSRHHDDATQAVRVVLYLEPRSAHRFVKAVA